MKKLFSIFSTLFLIFLFSACQTAANQEPEEATENSNLASYSAYSAQMENLNGTETTATADMSFDSQSVNPFALLVVFIHYVEPPPGEHYEVFLVKGDERKDMGSVTYTEFGETKIPMFLYNSQDDLTYFTDVEILLDEEVAFKGTFQPK